MMSKPMIDDPNTLAGVITGLGGTVIPGRTFRFEVPRANVRDVVPRLNKLGVGVRRISERTEMGPKSHTVTTLELYRPDANKLNRIEGW